MSEHPRQSSSSQKKRAPVNIRLPSSTNLAVTSTSSSPGNRPTLRWRASDRTGRFQFSTDDYEEEIEADLEREYFEGYTDGLKENKRRRARARAKGSPAGATGSPVTPGGEPHVVRRRRSELINELIEDDNAGGDELDAAIELEHEAEMDYAEDNTVEEAETEEERRPHVDEREREHGDEIDNSDVQSVTSVETFTLRERQDAINTTHPFGIKLWKPAIYKKMRSVQKIAEGDIHSTPGKSVTWPVMFGNALWTILFGFLLLAVCTVASASCMLLFWSPSARVYGRKLFSLGTYLWSPFGKFIELVQDEDYLHEDLGEGRSLAEYRRWQAGDVEYGRLFFEPSRKTSSNSRDDMTNTNNPNNNYESEETAGVSSSETQPLLDDSSPSSDFRKKRRLFGRGKWTVGRIMFFVWYYVAIAPLLYLISLVCWLGVFSIPMAKVTSILADQLRRHPLALKFKPAKSYAMLPAAESSSVLLCTYRALGWNYYKYTVDGTNIFFINLMFAVVFVIFDYFVLYETLGIGGVITSPATAFTLSLLSVVPLAYFIGQAVASISAQSSMGMGAAINAFFSTIVEVFLYAVALSQGKGDLVEGSIVGSILAGVLLMPGLSMCAGAIKRKTQRYNPRSAGVSSTMLIFAVIGAFAPTIFYQIYGTYEMRCRPCQDLSDSCRRCQLFQVPLEADTLYTKIIQPFSYICAILLFVAYIIGLWFTLRTHAAMIWTTPTVSELPPTTTTAPATTGTTVVAAVDPRTHRVIHSAANSSSAPTPILPPVHYTLPVTAVPDLPHPSKHVTIQEAGVPVKHEEEAGGGHDAPNWSRRKSTIILLGATWLYAIIAEILVDTVDVVLQNFKISPKLLGITVFALVPNTTEFLNAISFAVNGNIALSMEIGSAYALQVCLLQIPGLVLYSIWTSPTLSGPIHDFMFTLVFPRWDLFMVILCVFLFSYIYAEGKSNYFKGSILILAYLVAMLGFVMSDLIAELLPDSGSLAVKVQSTPL
ncbi:low affinity vacuolar monovalent cation/H(+) antiporter [Trichomonascus vanleenenianus]|uniref:calcium/hydrogen antiporter n=1 Tax=Trichomonascus vanleenenianus TaxID=2268995 RepID=UPI003ECA3B87